MDGHLFNSLGLPAPQAEALAVSFELVKDLSKAVRDALVPAVVDSLSLEQLRSLWKAVVDTTQVMNRVQASLSRAVSELQDQARLCALFDSLNKKLATWNADMLHQEPDEHACVLLPEERFWAKYLVVPEYLDRMSVVGTVGGDADKCSVYRATNRIVDTHYNAPLHELHWAAAGCRCFFMTQRMVMVMMVMVSILMVPYDLQQRLYMRAGQRHTCTMSCAGKWSKTILMLRCSTRHQVTRGNGTSAMCPVSFLCPQPHTSRN